MNAEWLRRPWLMAALLAAAAASLTLPGISMAEETPLPGLKSTLGRLQKGGFVIYLRHGETDREDRPDNPADLTRCDAQRNLTAEGRDQSVRIGKSIRALAIPIGVVKASPFCRAKETARLAFGRFAVEGDLHFAIDASAAEQRRLTASLRHMLSTPPAPRTNTVIVAHSANLREAAGIWPKPEGVAFVFLPLPNGRFEAVAKILPNEWAEIAKQKPSTGAR